MASSLPILITLSSLSTLSAAYTWKFASPPQQCSNLTVSLAGSGGVPPYRLLVLPNGPTPLSSGVEVRRILDVPFPDGSRSVSFQLKYPAFSQLVAVVSISLCSYFFFVVFSSFSVPSQFLQCFWCCRSQGCICQCSVPPRRLSFMHSMESRSPVYLWIPSPPYLVLQWRMVSRSFAPGAPHSTIL
jgi:hypothetical protein